MTTAIPGQTKNRVEPQKNKRCFCVRVLLACLAMRLSDLNLGKTIAPVEFAQ